jgi:hypothetical protein
MFWRPRPCPPAPRALARWLGGEGNAATILASRNDYVRCSMHNGLICSLRAFQLLAHRDLASRIYVRNAPILLKKSVHAAEPIVSASSEDRVAEADTT